MKEIKSTCIILNCIIHEISMHHLCTNQYEIAKLFFAPEKNGQ